MPSSLTSPTASSLESTVAAIEIALKRDAKE